MDKCQTAVQTDKYTYRVSYSEDDKEYVGLCAELPSLSWLDASRNEAFSGIQDLVSEVVEDMRNTDEDIPEPLSLKKYSGKFMVRIPPAVHRDLSILASENNISLNRLVSSKLS
ncbi:MAG: toxin-antitoxin system HicB family antitoxin [Thiotrichales bacterium]|nr:toxin-antitoxin system HicB family antitoxin [Thiotrichales bacterium]